MWIKNLTCQHRASFIDTAVGEKTESEALPSAKIAICQDGGDAPNGRDH
jgi:hypothetical protein